MATWAIKATPHVSWHRTATGGVYALGAFVFLIGGYMALRAAGIGPAGSLLARGSIAQDEKLLVDDFQTPNADSTLGPVVTAAFRTSLGQSQSVQVLQINAIRDLLRRMERPANTHIDFALARDIAAREGIKAVMEMGLPAARQLLSEWRAPEIKWCAVHAQPLIRSAELTNGVVVALTQTHRDTVNRLSRAPRGTLSVVSAASRSHRSRPGAWGLTNARPDEGRQRFRPKT